MVRPLLVPENGKSLFDYLRAEQSGQMRDDAAQNGEGYKITPIPAAAFAVTAQDAAWVDRCASGSHGDIRAECSKSVAAGTEARVLACRRLGAVALPAIRHALQGRSRLAFVSFACGRGAMMDLGACGRSHCRR